MKITNKILNIPPYISTSWNYIDGIYMKGATLVVNLFGGEAVNIPGLKSDIIAAIFAAHAESLEQEASQSSPSRQENVPQQSPGLPIFTQAFPLASSPDSSFHLGVSSMDGLGTAMQHNPAHADAPDIPLEILQKISAIVKIMAPEDVFGGAQAVPGCNCPHCQITRVISPSEEISFDDFEAKISNEAEDLRPSRWVIQPIGENLFSVVDNEDASLTEYKVFLGQPVGCTCGKEGCDHIVAVLKS